MDKKYKAHFQRLLKKMMKARFPDFKSFLIPRDAPYWPVISGLGYIAYFRDVGKGRKIWIEFMPDEGVGREIFVFLGWTVCDTPFPTNHALNEPRMTLERDALPIAGITGGSENIKGLEGSQGPDGFRIPSPWDELLKLPLKVSKQEERRVAYQCLIAEDALTDLDREASTARTLDEALSRLGKLIPDFTEKVKALPDYEPLGAEIVWNAKTYRYE